MKQNNFFKSITLAIIVLLSTTAFGQITWTGGGNVIKWLDTANWQGGVAPTASDDVIIPNLTDPTKYPQPLDIVTYSTVTVNVNSITLEDGALILHNDALGPMTINGTINYKRNLATNNWYLMSSPVIGETVENLLSNHTFASGTVDTNNRGIGTYVNTTTPNSWTYATSSSTGTLTPGNANSIKLASAGEITFTGTFNNSSTVSIPLTQGTTGFNLIGNPFIAPINANKGSESGTEFLDTNKAKLEEETIWLWNQATNTYDVINNTTATTSIGVGQGFFVQLKSGTASDNVEITSGMQGLVTGVGNPFQKQSRPKIKLNITQNDVTKHTDIFFIKGTTNDFDSGYDSSIFGGIKSDFEVYTQLVTNNKGKNLAIQSLPNDNFENVIIPVGLIAKGGQEITFSANAMNLPSGIDVYLEDRTNNLFTKIAEEKYKITLQNNIDGVGQFYLHTASRALSTEDIKQELANVSVYQSSNNKLTISGLQAKNATIKIFSVLGKNVFSKTVAMNGVKTIDLPNLNTGVYIVNITSSLGKVSKKVVLK